jgi:phosphopantetheinyl transferase (holo-ACP synthase)
VTALIFNHSDLIFEKCMNINALQEMNLSDFLSKSEWMEYDHWKADSRKKQWLSGRYLAKSLIQEHVLDDSDPFNQIEIRSRNSIGQSVRPEIFINGIKTDCSLSISHTEELAWAVLSLNNETRIGIDLVPEILSRDNQSNSKHLLQWFTNREKENLTADSTEENIQKRIVQHYVIKHWAIKEALYKAINNGESFSPLKIEILRSSEGSYNFIANGENITHLCHLQEKQFDSHTAILVEVRNR